MVSNFYRSNRRILTFPAIHPCKSISSLTLLDSLIELSQTITNFNSKSFSTQRRNARQTIRLIGIVLIFFQEIQEQGLSLDDPVLIRFTKLHLTLQKIKFLLEDCIRDGAKLLVLLKSQFIATKFRDLIHSVATALDVSAISLISVGAEITELVSLVAKQARKAKLELDPDVEKTTKRVLAILKQFEKGIEPDLTAIKRVLAYVQVRSWFDCHNEIKFLEDEIFAERSDINEIELELMSGLMGLMSYSRVVIFERFEYKQIGQSEVRIGSENLSWLNPEDFRCPISLELMVDPVTVSTGHTYDRSSIEKWLAAGNLLCPQTGESLMTKELVPNTTLRKLINQFCADHNVSLPKSTTPKRDIGHTINPGSPAAAKSMKFLSEFLTGRLRFGTIAQKDKAAYEIRLLSKSSIFNQTCLIKAGTIPHLLNLLMTKEGSVQENSMAALLKLSKRSVGKKVVIENGGLTSILDVLKRGSTLESRRLAATTIFYLSSVKEYRKLIGEMPGAIPALTNLVKDGTTCGKKNAIMTIFGLLLSAKNHQKVIESGTILLLIEIIASSKNEDLVSDSLAVLTVLAVNTEATIAILEITSSLCLFAATMQSITSKRAKEHCVSILHSMCMNGGLEVVAVLAKEESLMGSLYSLLTDGTSQAKRKARSLIRILHRFYESSSSGLMKNLSIQ